MAIIQRPLVWNTLVDLSGPFRYKELALTQVQVDAVTEPGGVLVMVYLFQNSFAGEGLELGTGFTQVSKTRSLGDPRFCMGVATRPLDTDCYNEIKQNKKLAIMRVDELVQIAMVYYFKGASTEDSNAIFINAILNQVQSDEQDIPPRQTVPGAIINNDIPAGTQSVDIFVLSKSAGDTTLPRLYRKSDGALVATTNTYTLYYQVQQALDLTNTRANSLADYRFENHDYGFGVTLLVSGISDGVLVEPPAVEPNECNIAVFDILASLYVATLRYTFDQCFNGREDGSGVITDLVIGASFSGGYDLETVVADICFAYNIQREFTAQGVRFYKNKIGIDSATVVAVIDESELAVTDTDSAQDGIRYAIATNYSDSSNIITKLTLNFIDADNEYATNQITAKRPDALQTDAEKQISIPFVMKVNTAEKLVNQLLTVGRLSLTEHTFRLPPTYLWIGKGDIVQINHGEFADTVRITDTDLNADKSQSVTAETVATATNNVPNSAYTPENKYAGPIVATYGIVLDIPTLNSTDSATDEPDKFEMYYGLTPQTPGQWLGGYFARRLDGESWETLFHTYGQPTKPGQVICRYNAQNALSDKRWVTDTDTLTLINASALWDTSLNTDAEGLSKDANRNLAVYGVPGRWEIIQFEAINDGVMSGIKRGLRGTEYTCGDHLPFDRVFIIYPALALTRLPVTQLGKVATNRAVSEGLPFVSAEQTPGAPFQGNSRRPFAPYHFKGVRGSNGDVTLSWLRRDRNGSGWGNASPPMSETVLAFTVNICDTDGKVLRTLAATDTNVVYSQANQQADGLDSATSISLIIAQIGDIGAGFEGKGTVNV